MNLKADQRDGMPEGAGLLDEHVALLIPIQRQVAAEAAEGEAVGFLAVEDGLDPVWGQAGRQMVRAT